MVCLEKRKILNNHKMNLNAKGSEKNKIKNAIVALASKIGSVYSIIFASEFNSEVSQQTKILYEETNKIAYKAEEEIFDVAEIKKVYKHISTLTSTINRKKAINPLISDELISIVKKALIDAEKVVKMITTVQQHKL